MAIPQLSAEERQAALEKAKAAVLSVRRFVTTSKMESCRCRTFSL